MTGRKQVKDMLIGLVNVYGYDRHELVTKVEDNFEYAGTDIFKGVTYDCYLVPNGITYKAVCVERVNSAIAEFEPKGVTYGVYNGITPIVSGIESFDEAQAVFYNTAKTCDILGLRCNLVNETTGEVIK